ncbi:di-trans,poly-cis-decaprenylcistransferase [Chromatiales bacterium (ex Bugula neritina AB1)]|nr:di-trans,poly-cis-decaprenylcistransferase [Chromatiales bacterium (ex Bugula neritina AB1)]
MSNLPEHIAIIMDGNGRWARQSSLPRSSGHQAGVKTIRQVVEHCARLRIGALTVYAFSSENWQRPEKEVSFLMELFVRALRSEVDKLHENNIAVRFIGELDVFPQALRDEIRTATEKTADNTGMRFNIAVNYGGRREMTRALTAVCSDVQKGILDSSEIDEQLITRYTWLADVPEPDLFIRTGGEQRLSNFLLWHLAYTELFFTNTLWPDFSVAELDEAIAHFTQRQRRFGQTGEQVEDKAHEIK